MYATVEKEGRGERGEVREEGESSPRPPTGTHYGHTRWTTQYLGEVVWLKLLIMGKEKKEKKSKDTKKSSRKEDKKEKEKERKEKKAKSDKKSKKEKKYRKKDKKNESVGNGKITPLSSEDFFLKSEHFRVWLKVHPNDMSVFFVNSQLPFSFPTIFHTNFFAAFYAHLFLRCSY